METILLLAHTEADGSLAKSAREALHAARTLNKSLAGSSLVVGLVGETVQAAADSIAACPATKYFGVAGKDFAQSRYASDAAAAEAFASRPKPRLLSLRRRHAGRACCPVSRNASADAPTPT
ncbi:MAG: hypothetical protein ACLP2Y_12795 [Limisphaerales bacterium]